MDIQIKKIPEKSQVELTVSVTAEELEPHVERAAKNLSKDNPVKGFRPGKASLEAATKAFGKDRLLSEVIDKAVPRWFVQAVLEHDIDALGRPSTTVSKADIETGITFSSIVDVLPDVTLGDPQKITAEKKPVTVTDDDVKQELTVIAKSRSTYIDVLRPAEKGDTVIADFTVAMNGQPIEGGSSKNHPIQLGEGYFIPDFENKLQGILAGDEREISMTFPDDFSQEELRGKQASATVKAHEIKKRVVPEINDEFAQKLGKFDSLQHLSDELKKNLLADKAEKEADRLGGELTEKLADLSTFGVLPDSLIEREIDRRLQELLQLLAYQQKTLDQYLEQTKKTPEQLRVELREPAERTVKVSLALRQFAKEQSLEATDEEINEKAQAIIQHYQGPDHDGHKHEELDPEEVKEHVKAQIRNQKAIDKLKELATIKEAKS